MEINDPSIFFNFFHTVQISSYCHAITICYLTMVFFVSLPLPSEVFHLTPLSFQFLAKVSKARTHTLLNVTFILQLYNFSVSVWFRFPNPLEGFSTQAPAVRLTSFKKNRSMQRFMFVYISSNKIKRTYLFNMPK